MIQLTLKDGGIRELEAPTAAAEVIKGIGMGLYKAACCASWTARSVTCVPLSTMTAHLRS
ncbi:MAG: hypothetical protein ACLR5S_02700 [Ruminococcus sp.]